MVQLATSPDTDWESGALVLIDKPLEWTSFDVVNKVRNTLRRALGKKIKVGHAGTLDPLATGLMILATGKATKQLQHLTGLDKTYTGTLRFGATTPSFDLETEPDAEYPIEHLNQEVLEKAVEQFKGDILQHPPVFSAIKKDGKPLYKSARKGKAEIPPPRPVTIHQFRLIRIALPEADFEVHCSKGTYIRSLVHDFGQEVGSGAHLTSLRRTSIGEYKLESSFTVEEFVNLMADKSQRT